MRTLYIDTSSSYLYTGIVENNFLLYEIKEELGHELSKLALPNIVKLFEKTNLEAKDIDRIIVVNGPGSFTGIRIGITIAKVYAWSLNIPITTITSLEAMSISSKSNNIHVPIIDARREYVFGAIFDQDNNEILKPQHITKESLKEKLTNISNYTIISNDIFTDFSKIEKYDPDILKIVEYCKNKKDINPHAVNPEYLKLTEAEENKLKNDSRTN